MTATAIRIYRPLADRLLVRPAKPADESKGGIVLPGIAQEEPMEGTVVAIGKGCVSDPEAPDEGDVVLYQKYAGHQVTVNDEPMIMLSLADVMAVITEARD